MKSLLPILRAFFVSALAATALLVSASFASASVFPIVQSFGGTGATGWVLGGSATLTSSTGVDTAPNGWLRLTTTATGQQGYAYYNTAFSSSEGVAASFDYAGYGGSGADGITFFLFDGSTTTFNPGAAGGALSYNACYGNSGRSSVTTPGLSGGVLGVGLDEYGNFGNEDNGCYPNGGNGTSLSAGTVGVRGSAATDYDWLGGATASSALDGTRAEKRHVVVSITPNNLVSVWITYPGTPATSQEVLDNFNASSNGALPSTLKFGFAGSTGGSTNYHEVQDTDVAAPTNLTAGISSAQTGWNRSAPVTFTTTVTNSGPNPTNGATITSTSGGELTNISWTCSSTSGGATCGAASGTGELDDTGADLPDGSELTYTITGTPTDTDNEATETVTDTTGSDTIQINPTINTATDTVELTPYSATQPTITEAANGHETATPVATILGGGSPTPTYVWDRCDQNGANCVATSNTTTSYTTSSADAGHTLVFVETATNAAGTGTFTSNPTPLPSATITSEPAAISRTTSGSFSFSTTQSGATFLCSLDGASYTACTSPINYSGLTGSEAGTSHTFNVEADYGGLYTTPVTSYTWTVKTSTVVAISSPANDFYTSNTTPTINFTTDDGNAYVVKVNGTTVVTGTDSGSGSDSVAIPNGNALSPDGAYTITVAVTDSASNTASAQTIVNVETSTSVAITSPANHATVNATPTLNFTITPDDTYALTIDGSSTVVASGTDLGSGSDSVSVPGGSALSAGTHTLTITATDQAGVTNTSTITVTAKTSTTASITSPTNHASVNSKPTIDFDVEDGDTYTLSVDSSQVDSGTDGGSGSDAFTLPNGDALSAGSHTISLTATDAVGNTATSTITVTAITATSVAITSPANHATVNATPTLHFTITTGDTYALTIDGGSTVVASGTDSTGSDTATVPGSAALSAGSHTLTITATDSVGNTATSTITLTAKTSTTVAITSPANHATVSATPTLDFTIGDGDTYTLTVDGSSTAVASGTDGGSGSDTVTVPGGHALSAGSHTLTVTATDSVGNTATSTITVTAKTSTSVTITSPAPSATVSATPTVDFTIDPNDTYTLTVDGGSTQIASGTDGGSGSDTATVPGGDALSAGSHTLTITATDSVGNTATASVIVTAKISTSVTITSPAPSATVSATPTVDFTIDPSDTYTLTVDGGSTVIASGTDGGSGSDTATVPGGDALSPGSHTLTITATDAVGNTATSSVTITAKATTSVAITSPAASATVGATPTVTFTIEPDDSYVLTVDGGSTQIATGTDSGSGSDSVTVPGGYALSAGPHLLTITATDAVGNTAVSTVSVTAKTSTNVTITAPSSGAIVGATPTVSFTIDPGDSFALTIDGGGSAVATGTDNGAGTDVVVVPGGNALSAGAHTLTITATDAVGNTAVSSVSVLAKTSTAVTLTSPGDGTTTTNPEPTITFTAEPNESVVVTVDGVNYTTTTDGNGNGTLTVPTPLSDGVHTISVTVTDVAGNTATSPTVHLTVNTTPPPAPTITGGLSGVVFTNQGPLDFKSVTANDLCQLDGGAWEPCSSGDEFANLALGSHTLAVEAVGADGALSAATTVSFIVSLPPTSLLSNARHRIGVYTAQSLRVSCVLDHGSLEDCIVRLFAITGSTTNPSHTLIGQAFATGTPGGPGYAKLRVTLTSTGVAMLLAHRNGLHVLFTTRGHAWDYAPKLTGSAPSVIFLRAR